MSNPEDEPDFYSLPYCFKINQELESTNPVASQNVSSTLPDSRITMENGIPMQDLLHRSAIVNNSFPPKSVGIPMAQCAVQPSSAENIAMLAVDRIAMMPMLHGRF